jgi:hypothetical protein
MKSPSRKTPPVLKQFANFWSLAWQPTKTKEWSVKEKVDRAKKAGFAAMGGGVPTDALPFCEKNGMDFVCYIDANMKSYKERLKAAKTTNPARINVQACDHDTPPKEAVKVWLKVVEEAKKLGLNVDLEVHRDTCTETPEKTYEIADLYKKATGKNIQFCWDFSHFAVVKHINPPYAARMLERPELVQAARQFHFRPFNGHHCQIPATDGKGNESPEIKPYFEFIDQLFACWLKGAKGGEVLYVCPEYGMMDGSYGLSCFPNIWNDTIFVAKKTEALWKKNLRNWK